MERTVLCCGVFVPLSVDYICVSLFLGFLLNSIGIYVCLMPVHGFNYYSFVIYVEIRKYGISSCVLLPPDCFGYSGSFLVAHEF